MKFYKKKFNIISPLNWSHHRGGWPLCINELINKIHNKNGINFYTNGIVSIIEKKPIKNIWSAIFHVTPGEIILNKNWIESAKYCVGAYALCKNTANYVSSILNIYCEVLYYPITISNKKFDIDYYEKKEIKKVIHVGHWLRNIDAFIELKTSKQKELLNCLNSFTNIDQKKIKIIEYLPDIVEYLGEGYPLYYNSIKEASLIIENENLIKKGHEYLKEMNKQKFKIDYFIKSILNSKIYKYISIY